MILQAVSETRGAPVNQGPCGCCPPDADGPPGPDELPGSCVSCLGLKNINERFCVSGFLPTPEATGPPAWVSDVFNHDFTIPSTVDHSHTGPSWLYRSGAANGSLTIEGPFPNPATPEPYPCDLRFRLLRRESSKRTVETVVPGGLESCNIPALTPQQITQGIRYYYSRYGLEEFRLYLAHNSTDSLDQKFRLYIVYNFVAHLALSLDPDLSFSISTAHAQYNYSARWAGFARSGATCAPGTIVRFNTAKVLPTDYWFSGLDTNPSPYGRAYPITYFTASHRASKAPHTANPNCAITSQVFDTPKPIVTFYSTQGSFIC